MELNSISTRLAVSENQKSLWFMYQLDKTASAYNMYFHAKLGGKTEHELDLTLLRQSFYACASQHNAIRTAINQDESGVYASLMPEDVVQYTEQTLDLTDKQQQQWLNDFADQPFILETGYLCRVAVLYNSRSQSRYLTLVLHHIAGDYYALEQLMRSWATHYLHLTIGSAAPTAANQYTDWLADQQEYLCSPQFLRDCDFWQQSLQPFHTELNLPTDREKTSLQSFSGDELSYMLPDSLITKVRTFAKQLQTTPYTVLLSAFKYYLHKLSGQEKFLLATPTMGRFSRRHQDVVGYCVNPIVLPADFSAPQSFTSLVNTQHHFLKQARPHHKLPVSLLTDLLLTTRQANRAGLSPCMFTYTRGHDHALADPICNQVIKAGQRGAAHELNLVIFDFAGQMHCHWRYNSALFNATTVDKIARNFFTLLQSLLLKPDLNLADLSCLEWLPEYTTLPTTAQTATELLLQQPDTAIALMQNNTVLSYHQLKQQALLLAGELAVHHIGFNDHVAVLLPRDTHQVVAMLGAWFAGAAYVPIDEQQPVQRINDMLFQVTAKVCVGAGKRPDWLHRNTDWIDISTPKAQALHAPLPSGTTAYLIFTSGSTGTPKAVSVSQRALASYAMAIDQRLTMPAGSVYASLASAATDLGYTALWGGLLNGHAVRMLPVELMLDPEALAAHLKQYPVDMLKVVPSHLQGLLASENSDILPRQALVFGGEGVNRPLLQTISKHAPQLRLFNHYGPTETTVGVIAGRLTADTDIALGTALPGCQIYLLDSKLQPVPHGAIGELYIGGQQLADCYWQDPEKTAQHFVQIRHLACDRLYKTGDRARLLYDGRIQFIGRNDSQIKIRGYRVELAEIENQLNAIEGITEAALLFEQQAERQALTAFVVGKTTLDSVKQALEKRLPVYMLPHFWQQLKALPRAVNGKIDRKALAQISRAELSTEQDEITQPDHQTNQFIVSKIREVWQHILQLDSIQQQDNFFSLGGDSILALQCIAALKKAGIRITPQDMFRHQTLAALAAHAAQDTDLSQPEPQFNSTGVVASARSRYQLHTLPDTLAPDEISAELSAREINEILEHIPARIIDDVLPLTPTQQGILFHCLLAADTSLYVNVTTMSVTGDIAPQAFLNSWQQAALRHDALRSRFIWRNMEQPCQVVCRDSSITTEYFDWRHLPDNQAKCQQLITEQKQAGMSPFDTQLMRLILIRLSEQDYRLIWIRHHLIVDGWTSALIAGEAMQIYHGKPLTPAPRLAKYFDWLNRQPKPVADGFWRNYLQDYDGGCHLPCQSGSASGQGYHKIELSTTLTRQLNELANTQGLTLNSLLQTAWALTLTRFTGSYDVIFGMTSAGRHQDVAGINDMAGVFISNVPLRVKIYPATPLLEMAKSLQINAAGLRSMDYVSLADIQQNVSLQPGEWLFDTSLILQNYPLPPALTEQTQPEFQLLEAHEHSNIPLMLQITSGQRLNISCSYDSQLVSSALLDKLITCFISSLSCIATNSEIRVHDVLQQLTPEISCQAKELPAQDFFRQFLQCVSAHPEHSALITTTERLSYAQLSKAVVKAAAILSTLVQQSQAPVALHMTRSAGLLINVLAIYRLGLSYIPLDTGLPTVRITNILAQARPQLIISEQDWPDITCVHPKTLQNQTSDTDICLPVCHSQQLAYTIFTSGSTGQPKGVQISRQALNQFIQAMRQALPLSNNDKFLALTTIGFDISVLELLLPITTGATIILANELQQKDPQLLSELIQAQQVTVMQATPASWQTLAEIQGNWWQQLTVLTGGEALPRSLANRLYQQAKRVLNVYGPTEATVWASAKPLDAMLNSPVAPLGKPLNNSHFYLLDAQLYPVVPGVAGDLYIGGSSLASGYLDNPELTATQFIPDPFTAESGQRMYRTGDRVYLGTDGELHYLGRADQQLKLRGYRIEPGEIEQCLMAQNGVREAVALVWQADTQHGYIAAYVTATEGQQLNVDKLMAVIAELLPAYMLPRHISVLDALPLNSNGKLDRKALPQPDRQNEHCIAPRNEFEQQLLAIWSEVLQQDRISVEDSFFDLGGNSLSATRLQTRIQRTFNTPIALAELFHNPTIAELASQLANRQQTPDDLSTMSELLDLFE